ncbi:hypothetical protein OPV22_035222 [Ensete ventricosum]|uniref:Uncharacterized protein n=1 Tax=Ensete ventricosum TaxID=4639 RepID=A0AAX5KEA9_ENSVE|nr:hypothetical protein OPV22_035222 [Ensete ventricosum]
MRVSSESAAKKGEMKVDRRQGQAYKILLLYLTSRAGKDLSAEEAPLSSRIAAYLFDLGIGPYSQLMLTYLLLFSALSGYCFFVLCSSALGSCHVQASKSFFVALRRKLSQILRALMKTLFLILRAQLIKVLSSDENSTFLPASLTAYLTADSWVYLLTFHLKLQIMFSAPSYDLEDYIRTSTSMASSLGYFPGDNTSSFLDTASDPYPYFDTDTEFPITASDPVVDLNLRLETPYI